MFRLDHEAVVVGTDIDMPAEPTVAAREASVGNVGVNEFIGKAVATRKAVNSVCSQPRKCERGLSPIAVPKKKQKKFHKRKKNWKNQNRKSQG